MAVTRSYILLPALNIVVPLTIQLRELVKEGNVLCIFRFPGAKYARFYKWVWKWLITSSKVTRNKNISGCYHKYGRGKWKQEGVMQLPEKNAIDDWQDQAWNNNAVRMSRPQIIPPTRTNRMKPLFHIIFIGESWYDFPLARPSLPSTFTTKKIFIFNRT